MSMRTKLTDAYLRNLAPGPKRVEVSDTVRPGLRFRLSPAGRSTWVYEKRVKGGQKRKHDLGEYPLVSIKDARRLAAEIQIEADAGIDRVAERERTKAREKDERASQVPLETVLETYEAIHASRLKTGSAVMRALRAALHDQLKEPARAVTQVMLQEAVDAKVLNGAPVQANRLTSYLVHFSRFSRARGHFLPGIGTDLLKPTKEVSRDRVLTLEEIRIIYNASFDLGDLWGPLIRLLILTAQRKQEIAGLKWGEFNATARYLDLGGSRTKNSIGHITHLSDPAMAELLPLRERPLNKTLVFTTTGYSPVSGFSKKKKQFDEIIGVCLDPWTFHDFRTAFATAMSDANEDEGVVDRVLNHKAVGSAPSAVSRVYNRSDKLPERKRVLDHWGQMVTGQATADVIKINDAMSA